MLEERAEELRQTDTPLQALPDKMKASSTPPTAAAEPAAAAAAVATALRAAAANSSEEMDVVDIEASVPGTPPTSPIPSKSRRTRQDSISGGQQANPPFLQPESGFASPASGVLAPEEDGTVSEDYPARRRSTRKGGQRDALFRRRLQKQGHRDMLYELREDGTYEMKEMSIREVFNYVQEIVAPYALGLGASPRGNAANYAQQQQQQQRQTSAPLSTTSTPSRNPRDVTDGRGYGSVGDSGGSGRMRRTASVAGVQMSSLNLHLRDMRQLFSSQSKSEPAISVRRNCVLVNFETLRGIVLVDRILLVVDPGADSILMEVRKALSQSHDDVYEFELKAVEALLSVSSKRLVTRTLWKTRRLP
ncbi:unnamed protein product [Ectocarpus sp. 12 AP-2014]